MSPLFPLSRSHYTYILQDIAPSNLLVRIGEYNVLNTNEPHKHIDRCCVQVGCRAWVYINKILS